MPHGHDAEGDDDDDDDDVVFATANTSGLHPSCSRHNFLYKADGLMQPLLAYSSQEAMSQLG